MLLKVDLFAVESMGVPVDFRANSLKGAQHFIGLTSSQVNNLGLGRRHRSPAVDFLAVPGLGGGRAIRQLARRLSMANGSDENRSPKGLPLESMSRQSEFMICAAWKLVALN